MAYCSFKHNRSFAQMTRKETTTEAEKQSSVVDKSTPPTHSWIGPLPQHFLPLSASRRGQVSHWASHGPTMAFTPHNIITHIYWWNRSISSNMKNEIIKFLLKLNFGELSETQVWTGWYTNTRLWTEHNHNALLVRGDTRTVRLAII